MDRDPKCGSPIEELVGGLHVKGALEGKLFTIPRNWLSPGKGSPSGVSKTPRYQNRENKKTWLIQLKTIYNSVKCCKEVKEVEFCKICIRFSSYVAVVSTFRKQFGQGGLDKRGKEASCWLRNTIR